MSLFDGSLPVLEKALDLYLVRHAVIADNIANAETPYFKARRVDFEGDLQKAMADQERGLASVDSVSANIYQDPLSEVGQDLNSVDMDREMARMAKNDMQYSAATQAVSKKFALMKYAISGGTE